MILSDDSQRQSERGIAGDPCCTFIIPYRSAVGNSFAAFFWGIPLILGEYVQDMSVRSESS